MRRLSIVDVSNLTPEGGMRTPQTEAQMVATLTESLATKTVEGSAEVYAEGGERRQRARTSENASGSAPDLPHLGFTAAQLEARRGGIGGSEIAAILGESPFAGPLDVWLSKVEGHQRPASEDMERGKFLEDGIAQWYAHREGVTAHPCETTWHATVPHVFATPDRLALTSPLQRIVSIKAPRRAGEAWGETGGSHVPVGYVLQLQWEHAVLSSNGVLFDEVMHLVALIDGELRVYPVPADVALQGRLLRYASTWWERHVEACVAPELDSGQGARDWLRRRFPRDTQPTREATMAEVPLLLALRDAEAAVSGAESTYETARRRVEEAIGDAGGLEAEGVGRVTWRASKKGIRTMKTYWRAGGDDASGT